MTQFLYELSVTNGKRSHDTFRFETDFTAALPLESSIFLRARFDTEEDVIGLYVYMIYHEMPIPKKDSDNPYILEGRVIMKIANGKGSAYIKTSNYKALVKYLKVQGWKSRREHNYNI